MKHIICIFVFSLLVGAAHADSVTFNAPAVTYSFGVNQGGDNAGYSISGPGITLSGGGSASCDPTLFCVIGVTFTPGMSLRPNILVDFESSQGSVTIDGQTYDAVLFISSINAESSFTFPIGGTVPSTFTVKVPAAFSVVQGDALNNETRPFSVVIPPAELVLTFDYLPAQNGQPANYTFSRGQYATTPEPETLALIVTGLISVVGIMYRHRRYCELLR